MDWKDLAKFAAPMIGGALPGIGSMLGSLTPLPGGAMMGEWIGKKIAGALGVPETPEAVNDVLMTTPTAEVVAKLAPVESEANAKLEELKAYLADVQDARETNVELVKAGSSIAWAPLIITGIVLLGFIILSFLAMKPDATGVRSDVALYLLGAWQGLVMQCVSYFVGSSSGSAQKNDQIAALAASRSTNVVPMPKRKAA